MASFDPLNTDPFMCSSAMDYLGRKSNFQSSYIKVLTVFMWTRIAHESAIDMVIPEKSGSRSDRLINYIKSNTYSWKLHALKTCVYSAYKRAPNIINQRAIKAAQKKRQYEFFHIHLCREARNDLFPSHEVDLEPFDEYNEEEYKIDEDKRVVFIQELTRLTLLDLQIIFFLYFKDTELLTGQVMTKEGIPPKIPIAEAVRVLHLEENCDPEVYEDIEIYDDEFTYWRLV